jgi:hypothetical protein
MIMPTEKQIIEDIAKIEKMSPQGISPEAAYVGKFSTKGDLVAQNVIRSGLLLRVRQPSAQDLRQLAVEYLKYFVIRLDGKTRFQLTEDRSKGDLLAQPQNILAHLFQDNQLRSQVSEIVHDTFGLYFTIDGLSENYRIRLSTTPPTSDEQNLNDAARKFHRNALHIADASDGMRAFVGILCAVFSGEYRAILIDEPEAFLHPPLARRLGYQLTTKLRQGGCLLASTHSADFLIGCLQASPNVRVVRLEYSNGKSNGRIIDSTLLTKFFRAPLMRSSNVISALFHDGVVVTESDNDRAFYSEIYYRLAEQNQDYPSILFVNAQNKQTVRDIVAPLRAFGVPAASVVDVDILKDGGADWIAWLKASHVPTAMHGALGQFRGDLKKCFIELGKEMKGGGVELLPDDDRSAANRLFDTLEEYGLFVVRRGELESWLSNLRVPGKKTDWTLAVLERMGSDPNSPHYVRPANGDVWDFMRGIVAWVKNAARQGMRSAGPTS